MLYIYCLYKDKDVKMSTYKQILFNLFLITTLTACSSDIFISHCGNMPSEERIEQVQKGQTKDEVLEILGSPSSIVSLDQNTWIYMSSEIKRVAFFKPEELDRDILTIQFNNYNQVVSIQRRNKDQGNEIAINEESTETYGSQPGFFAKYFGGVGQFMPFGKASSVEVNK